MLRTFILPTALILPWVVSLGLAAQVTPVIPTEPLENLLQDQSSNRHYPLIAAFLDRMEAPKDFEGMEQFVRDYLAESWIEHTSFEAQVEFLISIATLSNGFVPRSVQPTEPRSNESAAWVLLARSRAHNQWTRIRLGVIETDRPRLRSITILPAMPPEEDRTFNDLKSILEQNLSQLAAEDRFFGVVLIAHKDEVVFHEAFGEANRRWQIPNHLDTRFNLGISSMMFTAALTLKLTDQGLIDLDKPLGAQGFKAAERYPQLASLTPRTLLSHTAGLGNFLNDTYWSQSRSLHVTLKQLNALWLDAAERSSHSPKSILSRNGYLLLAWWLEDVSGLTWHALLNREILKPLNIAPLPVSPGKIPPRDLAIGYTFRNADVLKENTFLVPSLPNPADGFPLTAEEVLRFLQAVQDGTLFSNTMKAQALQKPNGSALDYGLGFELFPEPLGERPPEPGMKENPFGHRSAFPGISTRIEIRPRSDWKIVVLSNLDGGAPASWRYIESFILSWMKLEEVDSTPSVKEAVSIP